jgi:putative heme degradation protein
MSFEVRRKVIVSMTTENNKAEEIREWFKKDPSRMTMVASRHFGVPEGAVINALVGEWPLTELKADAFREIMDALKEVGMVRIFVRSRACVMECDGNLGEARYSNTGPFFNIDGGGLDMHILHKEIASAYALEKKSHMNPDDHTYSIQFYDKQGDAAFKVFLWQDFPKTPEHVVAKYRALVEKTATPQPATTGA